MGDAAGVGAEIIVKALAKPETYEKIIPAVYGDLAPLEDALRFTHHSDLKIRVVSSIEEAKGEYGVIDLVDIGLLRKGDWQYGVNSAVSGNAAYQYVTRAIADAMAGKCAGVVTGPISKEAIHMAGHNFSGHTEIFAHETHTRDYSMLLSCKELKVVHVTTHVSMEQACKMITKERVLHVIRLAQRGMRLLGYEHPRIAVAGFNAHCSENGLFGHQEADAIIPAVETARAEGYDVTGPIPPDTVFCKAVAGMFDIVVAMYHDQGHIPIKLMGFRLDAKTNTFSSMSGINCTIGLPIVRTSVDHGTAYDRAGKNCANEQSMLEAIDAAAVMAKNMKRLKDESV